MVNGRTIRTLSLASDLPRTNQSIGHDSQMRKTQDRSRICNPFSGHCARNKSHQIYRALSLASDLPRPASETHGKTTKVPDERIHTHKLPQITLGKTSRANQFNAQGPPKAL